MGEIAPSENIAGKRRKKAAREKKRVIKGRKEIKKKRLDGVAA